MAKLGFGIMRFRNAYSEENYDRISETITEYMNGSFCYFDIHPNYSQGLAQSILRDFVVRKYPRKSYLVGNKMPYFGINKYDDYQTILERELEACGLGYFDNYLLHAVTNKVYKMHEKIGGFIFLSKIKTEGLAKKIGFSFHDKPELLDEILCNHPEVDFVQLQINFIDWEREPIEARKCYEIAVKHKKPIIVMEPLKGGGVITKALDGNTSLRKELVEKSFGFINSLNNVEIILSGMTEKEQIIENRKFVEYDPSYAASKDYYEYYKNIYNESNSIQCTGCGYCKAECPYEIKIPEIISVLNDFFRIGYVSSQYHGYIGSDYSAGKCIACKKCEMHCPQKLEIHKIMRKAVETFEMHVKGYTIEKNAQMLIYILKANNIKRVIISPGATNICFAYSVQQDDFFEVYSCVDERSAAYIACGMAAETGEPIVLSCTGATASRNYLSGLTEAYYRNLPILAVTSTQPRDRYGNNIPQFVDRTVQPRDSVKLSVYIPSIHTSEENWSANVNINRAVLELIHKKPKPVHINLETEYNTDYSVKDLPPTRVIKRFDNKKDFPKIESGSSVGIYICAHMKMSENLVGYIDNFCEKYDAVVLQDHTGNYTGKYGILAPLVLSQENREGISGIFDILIHLGDVSGAYMSVEGNEVWRVDPEGSICDSFRTLSIVFETSEESFFEYYNSQKNEIQPTLSYLRYREKYNDLYSRIPELPFSNIWAAKELSPLFPMNSVLHLAILHSLRSFNLFETDKSVTVYSNTGGFGIDGCLSSLIGASLMDSGRLYYGIIGDLSFFYDMNALGNRHIGNNLRIMLVSNGLGTEFKNYSHNAYRFGDDADKYIAAAGHYGNKSRELVKNYAQVLGFQYISAENKEEFYLNLPLFTNPEIKTSILFEIFTEHKDESDSLRLMRSIDGNGKKSVTQVKKVEKPERFKDKYRNIVLWGTGNCFRRQIGYVKAITDVRYACDNDQAKWGMEMMGGIKCISPQEISQMEDVFVIIMLENIDTIMQVSNQLLDMEITHFDVVTNWLNYMRE